jgi:phosphohistidine phosphatase SixA
VVVGLALAGLGGLLLVVGHVPWLGRLPGDISVERENLRFYAPLATGLLLSVLLTLLLNVLWRR